MVVDLRLNKKGLFTAEAKYAQHSVFDRTIRKMEESLIERMNDVEGCLQACQNEKDSLSLKS